MLDWKIISTVALTITGGGIAALLYYLFKDEKVVDTKAADNAPPRTERRALSKRTRSEMLKFLQNLVEKHDEQRVFLKSKTQDLKAETKTLDELFDEFKRQPAFDLFENEPFLMEEFESIMETYHHDPVVMQVIGRLMGAYPIDAGFASNPSSSLSKDMIIAVHKSMVDFVDDLPAKLKEMQKRPDYDVMTATLVCQSYITAQVEKKHNISFDDVEIGLAKYQNQLIQDNDFASATVAFQAKMSNLLGDEFRGPP